MKANRLLVLLAGMMLVWLMTPGCEVLNMKRDLQKLKLENARLNDEIQRLETQLSESRDKVLQLQASNSELGIKIEKSAFHEQEIDRTLQGYKELEIEKNLLQQRVTELEAELTLQQAAIRELEKKLQNKESPRPAIPTSRFKIGDCVKWYGSPYKDLRTMRGVVVRSRSGLTYIVRCTETTMPYLWAKDGLYELQENNLVPCD